LLALGTLATFGYVTSVTVQYFHRSLGVPAALAIAGVLILGLAVISTRLMRAARPPKPSKPDAEEPLDHQADDDRDVTRVEQAERAHRRSGPLRVGQPAHRVRRGDDLQADQQQQREHDGQGDCGGVAAGQANPG
jgi:hypothetical protein